MDLTMIIIFIIKELAEEFEGQFTCLGVNTKKYIIISVPTEKEVTRIDKNWKEIIKTISCRLQIIDIPWFMAGLWSNLVNNLADGIHEIKCKYGHDSKKSHTCTVRYKDYDWFLEYRNVKDNLIAYKCLCCNKNYQKMFNEN